MNRFFTLNLDYGSSQPMHVDALYMKPRSPYNLLAVWIALEDVIKQAAILCTPVIYLAVHILQRGY